jgi:hypothetical protein
MDSLQAQPTITQRWAASQGSATADHADNPRVHWVPAIYSRFSATSVDLSEDEHWADLATQARAAWSRENPF